MDSGVLHMALDDDTIRLAKGKNLATVVTLMPDGQPQAPLTWIDTDGEHLLVNTEDVGQRFAEEARRIHYGETAQRGIRGQASPEEREALKDEGIETMALPVPAALRGPVQ